MSVKSIIIIRNITIFIRIIQNEKFSIFAFLAMSVTFFFSCAPLFAGGIMDKKAETPCYFKSPKESIEIISNLLRKKEWVELSRYYDLSDSNIDREELESGRFFYATNPPERAAHPGGFWKFKHPFAPGFKYSGHEADGEDAAASSASRLPRAGSRKSRGTLRGHPSQLRPSGGRCRRAHGGLDCPMERDDRGSRAAHRPAAAALHGSNGAPVHPNK